MNEMPIQQILDYLSKQLGFEGPNQVGINELLEKIPDNVSPKLKQVLEQILDLHRSNVQTLAGSGEFVITSKKFMRAFKPNRSLLLSYIIKKEMHVKNKDLVSKALKKNKYTNNARELLDSGFFYMTTEELCFLTTLNINQVDRGMKKLYSMGIIDQRIRDVPKKRFIKINYDRIAEYLRIKDEEFKDLDNQDISDVMTRSFLGSGSGLNMEDVDDDLDFDEELIKQNGTFSLYNLDSAKMQNRFRKNAGLIPQKCGNIYKEIKDKEISICGNDSFSYEKDSVVKEPTTLCRTSDETSCGFTRLFLEEDNDSIACIEELPCFRTSNGEIIKKENKSCSADESLVENKEEPLLGINKAASERKEITSIESSSQSLSSKKKTKNGTLRSDASEIINYWRSKGFTLKEKHEASTLIILEKLMKSSLLSDEIGFEKYKGVKFTKEQIIISIDKFHQAAFDNNYQPSSLTTKKKYQKIPLHTWIFNKFSKSKKSLFLCFHEKPVHLITNRIYRAAADDFPELTKAIKNEYVRTILKGIYPIVPWDEITENKFRQSAKNLNEFVQAQNGSLQSYARDALLSPESAARILANSILDSLNDKEEDWSKITPGWFSSSLTFNERLPKYLRKEFPVINYGRSSNAIHNPFAAI